MKRRFRLPSPAMVVAVTALAISVTGNVTAAVLITSADIKDNTIRSVDIRNRAVKGIDVKNNSLTGDDVKESTLGQVPSAANATTAANAGTLNGLTANQLARAATASSTSINDDFNTCTMTTLLSTAVNAPVNGVLLVWGSIAAIRDANSGAGQTGILGSRVAVDGVAATTVNNVLLELFGPLEGSVNVSGAIPVSAGSRTVALQAQECGAGMAFINGKSITTLFVPFGNTGQQGVLAATEVAAADTGQPVNE
jgi:hypothetical protein